MKLRTSVLSERRTRFRIVCAMLLSMASAGTTAQSPGSPPYRDFLATNLDTTVAPGEDFFDYANGGWLKRNPIPPTETSWGIFQLVRDQLQGTLRDINTSAAAAPAAQGSDEQKIGDFWATGMDLDKAKRLGIAPLQTELVRIDRISNVQQAIDTAFYLRPLQVDLFFQFFIDQDEKDSGTASAHVLQGGLGLPDRDFYVNPDSRIRTIRERYVAHITNMLRLLGRDDGAASAAAAEVMAFETSLAKASRKLEETRDPLTNYHRVAPGELTRKHTPSIAWLDHLAAWNIHPDFIAVGQPEYLDALDKVLKRTPIAVLKDYLRFRLVSEYADYLSPEFDNEHFNFYRGTLLGQSEQQPRWKRVLEAENHGSFLSVNPIGMAVGRHYVSAYFSEATKKRYTELVENIRTAYRDRINRLDWMSEGTKAKALEKLAKVARKVGYPDHWVDYSGLVVSRDSYCANMMNVARWSFDHMLGWYGKPVDRSEWRMTPQTYNAYYNPANNEIVLPAAIFVVPGVADADVDDAAAYGYVGASTVGHEITHGFDDQGRKFDAQGNLMDWWTAKDAAQYEKRGDVMVKQFDAYEPLPGFHINGKASLGENIADFGGVLLGLDAFKQTEAYKKGEKIAGMTPIQRFFLGYAYGWMLQEREEQIRSQLLSDVHAPVKWRVLGPLANVPDFYDAFGVQPDQPMWRAPAERVRIW
jgi:putative endopeptidase